MATLFGPVLQRYTDVYGEWVKLFRHDSSNQDFFSSDNSWEEARSANTSSPNGVKYSILSEWSHFERNSKFTLKLDYPDNSVTNIWSQTSNPVDSDGSGGVTGYTAISIDYSGVGWGGLERYDASSSSFLDGTLSPQSNWYFAIAGNAWTNADTFPGPGVTVSLVELWILDKPA